MTEHSTNLTSGAGLTCDAERPNDAGLASNPGLTNAPANTAAPALPADGHLLIVGAGLAGYHVARGVRGHGHTGPITIFGEENRPAYDRPALSKAYLTGAVTEEDLHLDDPEDPLDVTWVSGVEVVGLSGSARTTSDPQFPEEQYREPLGIYTADGQFHAGDAIVITTGASALTLPAAPDATIPHVEPYVLRDMEHALALRDATLSDADIVVVGGGFLALEAAATCIQRGAASVTVAASEQFPGARRLGLPVGQAIGSALQERGIRMAPPARAQAVRSGVDGHQVLLADGTVLTGDIVICAIGAKPRTEWLVNSQLTFTADTHAVLCDDSGATVIPGVYAAGDCAQWASHSSGLRPVGHWQEAVEEAAVVAAALTGADEVALQEPYFWSDQFDLRIQGAGRIHLANEVEVLAGTPEEHNLLVRYLRDGEEVGILGINRLRDVTRWRKQRRIRSGRAHMVMA
ncbi:NAD(P)/FAD-dependent oxidoreductase [Kocuria sp.]|uniref:NAD(P)/FAD-dependent oxidoreductase n=1 Tax=Kocuria sp. TaxID=1871328 RepID=UPI0026E05FEA|nr:FAD-dependent oxidoreductase [Kocuria sp.]MDO5618885.1 FAD-dependent oxidoreductase [Kocuria sp.]